MKSSTLRWLTLSLALATAGPSWAQQCDPGNGAGGVGADVVVGVITGIQNYGNAGGYYAYSVGTTSCNIGTELLDWIAGDQNHPVIAQNLYRLKDGVMEHVGMSWLKHGFAALQGNACGCTCMASPDGQHLGVGCSDPYGAGLNGSQGSLGARSEVTNPHIGEFIYPRVLSPNNQDLTWRRLRVHADDVNPALNSGALYFVEAQYVTPDDALAGNAYNNSSYRQVQVGGNVNTYPLAYVGSTERQLPAITAWESNVPGVVLQDVSTGENSSSPGRLIVGYNVTDNGNGTWNYEYAIYNQNSTRGVNGFTLPIPVNVNITNVGFHDVEYHSGESISGTDWPGVVASTSVSWNTDDESNPNANAIRWGSMYNFRFTADAPPTTVTANIDLWINSGFSGPNNPTNRTVDVLGPNGDFLDAPDNLVCTQNVFDAELSWTNPDAYDSINVFRDGVSIATLAGTATAYTDPGLSFGGYTYTLRGVTSQGESTAANCFVSIQLSPIANLACTSTTQQVDLTWTNPMSYTEIQIRRNGVLIASVPGTDTGYVDLGVGVGSYTYLVTAFDNGAIALPSPCDVDVNPAPSPQFDLTAESKSASYDEVTGEGMFSVSISTIEALNSPNYPNETTGFSVALTSDDTLLTPISIDLATSIAALNGGSGPSFFNDFIESDGVSAGVVYDFFATEFLLASSELELLQVNYETVSSALAGDPIGVTTNLTFVDFVLGTTPVENVIVVGSQSVNPTFVDSVIQLAPGSSGNFVRGDCNDDQSVNIADAVFLLDYLFPTPTPPAVACFDACDGNDDGSLNIADAVRVLDALFGPGTPLPEPTTCGPDPTADNLECDMSTACP